MPFPIVMGLPSDMEQEALEGLRVQLVSQVSILMGCPTEWVRPLFPADMLSRPANEESCTTILAKLETGMFHGRPDDDPQVAIVLKAIAQVVWNAVGGMYEVEASVTGWHPGWKHLIEPVGGIE